MKRRWTISIHNLGAAFTLLELLVVIGIIVVVVAFLAPAFTSVKTADNITNAAYVIGDTLSQARAYAMANNTYVWIGFYEENATAEAPTNATPPYPGRGRLLIAAVSSTDGTKIFDDTDPIALLPANRIRQIGKLITIDDVHVTDIGAPPSPTPSPTPIPGSLDARPNLPYAENSPTFDHFNRISSDSVDTTRFRFAAQNYTFYKTVRFNPRGEANINSTYALKHAAEIGIRSTHGTNLDTNTTNAVAIQFGGVSGNFKIYRR